MWRIIMAAVFAGLIAVFWYGLHRGWFAGKTCPQSSAPAAAAPPPPPPPPVEDLRRILELEAENRDLEARAKDLEARLDRATASRGAGAEASRSELDDARARLQSVRGELEAARGGQLSTAGLAMDAVAEASDLRKQVTYWKGMCGGGSCAKGRQGFLLMPPAGSLTTTSARVS